MRFSVVNNNRATLSDMHVVAGTLNPGKLTGAEAAVRRYWPDAAFAGVAVDHGTAAQPLTREQTLEGAIARARPPPRPGGISGP